MADETLELPPAVTADLESIGLGEQSDSIPPPPQQPNLVPPVRSVAPTPRRQPAPPAARAAAKEPAPMKPIPTPKTAEGLDRDPLTLLKEPLYVSVYRTRPGVRERVPLPNDGQRWNLEQVRAVEPMIEQVAGGGHYEIEVRDDRGMHKWTYDSSSPPKPLGPEVPQMTQPPYGGVYPGFPQFPGFTGFPAQQPAGPQAQKVDVPGFGTVVSVPGMAPFITKDTDGKSKDGNGGIMGPGGTPWAPGAWSTPWQQNPWAPPSPWGTPWGQSGTGQKDNEAEKLRLENERLRAEQERERQEARHREEMAELKASIARLAEARQQPVGPSAEVLSMEKRLAEMQAQLQGERDRNAAEQRFATLQAAHDKAFTDLRDEMRREREARPKEDPARPMLDFMTAQAAAERERAAAQERIAVAQAAAQKEQQTATLGMLREMANTSKGEMAAIVPMFLNLMQQSASVASGSMSAVVGAMREVLELKGKDDAPWWGEMIKGVLEPLPNVALQFSQAYAANKQAAAVAAMGGPQPPQGNVPPGRRPRAEGMESAPAVPAAPQPPQMDNPPAGVVKQAVDPKILAALAGVPGLNPGEHAKRDMVMWGAALPEIQELRKGIAAGQLKTRDCTGFLLNLIGQRKQAANDGPTGIVAIDENFRDDPVALATMVGLALGMAPQGVEAKSWSEFQYETLRVLIEALTEVAKRAQGGGEGEEGGEEAPDGDEGGDGSGGNGKGSPAPPETDTPMPPSEPPA